MTYVPVLRSEQFEVPCKGFFGRFFAKDKQTGLNWFLLSQTLNQKRKLLLPISSLLFLIFLITLMWRWLPHWKTHRGSYVCEAVVAKIQYHKLENRNMCRFFQHWRILLQLQLWLLLVDYFYCQDYMLCISKSLYDRQEYFRFSSKFFMKHLCARAMTKEILFSILLT